MSEEIFESTFAGSGRDIDDANPTCANGVCEYKEGDTCGNEYAEAFRKPCTGPECIFYGNCITCAKTKTCRDRLRYSTRRKEGD